MFESLFTRLFVHLSLIHMSHDQYTLRHSPDASLPGRACFFVPRTAELRHIGIMVKRRCDYVFHSGTFFELPQKNLTLKGGSLYVKASLLIRGIET